MPPVRTCSSGSLTRAHLVGSLAALALVFVTARATAAGPLGPNGSPIATSDYAVDLFQGPLFAGSRVTGLGGAYVAIAEDVDGDLQNPAAPAVRPFFSYTDFDYWLGFGLTFPATLQDTDFFNSGTTTKIANPPDSFVFFTPAVNLQWGELGIGLNLEVQQYALSSPSDDGTTRAITATIPTTHLQFAHGIAHNQLVVGVGSRFVAMTVKGNDKRSPLFESTGNGLEFGAVFKPENRPLRLGVAYRTAIRTEASYRDGLLPNENGDLIATGPDGTNIYLPKAVALPWDVNFGFAVQFGARPFNPPWRTDVELIERRSLEHRLRALDREEGRNRALASATTAAQRKEIEEKFERAVEADNRSLEGDRLHMKRRIEQSLTAMNRFYVQIAASMLISGPVEDAVGVESFVSQDVNRSGRKTVISPRLGIESGVLPDNLKVRAGTYIEPTRFDGSTPRVHVTAGLDVKLLVWNVLGLWPDDYMWRLGLGGDAAHRYYTWGVTIAGWYPRHTDPANVPNYAADPSSLD